MYKELEIGYNPANGPVSVNVKSGYVTQGVFNLHVINSDGFSNKIGEGRFGDGVADLFLIPINASQLSSWLLIILGNYVPAYGHSQISVDYQFYQRGALIHTESIRVSGTSLIAHHDISFTKN